MALARTAIKTQQTVKILVDPNPQFVSLVGHGANQTPFLTIKSHKPMPAPAKPTPVTKSANEAPTEIHKMLFSGEKFADETAVKAYLDEHGYTGFTIEAVEKDFVVKGIDEAAFKTLAPVAGDDGVTRWIGELVMPIAKAAAAPITPPAPVATEPPAQTEAEKAAEVTARTRTREQKEGERKPVLTVKHDKLVARKVDTWQAYYDCNDTTLAGVLEDANDGIPVGFYDIESAFIGALKNLVLSGDTAGIKSLTGEFGDIIVKLATLTAGAEKEQKADAVTALLGKPDAPAQTTPAPTTTQKAAEVTETPTLATLQKSIETLTKALETSQKEATEAKQAAEKANERATKLEQIRQTRKSADTSEVTAASTSAAPAKPAPTVKGSARTVEQKMADNAIGAVDM